MSREFWAKVVGAIIFATTVGATVFYILHIRPNKSSIAPGVAPEKPLHVAAIGDISCPHTKQPSQSECLSPKVAELIKKRSLDALFLLGDLQYDSGEFIEFQQSFDKDWTSLRNISYAVPGNHEYETPAAAGYFNYWNGGEASSKHAGERGKGYYSFNLGAWHFIALNSNCEHVSGCGEGSEQYKWLKEDIKKAKNKCTLAFWHHPLFTSGRYHDNLQQNSKGGPFWHLLDGNAAVILNGHDHIYQRFEPQNIQGNPDVNSPTEFVVGTGGKVLYKLTIKPQSGFAMDSTYGYLELALSSGSFSWWFRDLQNKVIDSGASECPR